MERKDIVIPVSGIEVKKRVHKQHKQRSDKGEHRKTNYLCKPFSVQLEQDLMEYVEANKGNMSRNQFINHLLRKGVEL